MNIPSDPQERAKLETRFWGKVEKGPGCWLWLAAKTLDGYGRVSIGGRATKAHRVSFELRFGPIRHGMLCLHRCDNPTCVRPDHLFLGTSADNARDMAAKGRSLAQTRPERLARGDRNGSRRHPERVPRGDRHGSRLRPERRPRGESNGASRLTIDGVREIRRASASREATQQELARMFGVSRKAIFLVVRRETWAHVDGPGASEVVAP